MTQQLCAYASALYALSCTKNCFSGSLLLNPVVRRMSLKSHGARPTDLSAFSMIRENSKGGMHSNYLVKLCGRGPRKSLLREVMIGHRVPAQVWSRQPSPCGLGGLAHVDPLWFPYQQKRWIILVRRRVESTAPSLVRCAFSLKDSRPLLCSPPSL